MITLISILQTFIGDDFLFNLHQRLIRNSMKKHIKSYLSGSVIRKINILEKFPEISIVSFNRVISELVTGGFIIDLLYEIERI